MPVQEQRTREVGRERTADLYYVTLIISLFLLLGEKTTESPCFLLDCCEKYRFPNKSRPEFSMVEWTTNTQEGNEQSGKMGPVFCNFTFDMTLHKLIDVLNTRASVGQLTSNQIYGLMNLMAFIATTGTPEVFLTSFLPHSSNNPPPRKGRMREKATVVIQIVVCPLISSLLRGFDKAQPSPQCYYTKKKSNYIPSLTNSAQERSKQASVHTHMESTTAPVKCAGLQGRCEHLWREMNVFLTGLQKTFPSPHRLSSVCFPPFQVQTGAGDTR